MLFVTAVGSSLSASGRRSMKRVEPPKYGRYLYRKILSLERFEILSAVQELKTLTLGQ